MTADPQEASARRRTGSCRVTYLGHASTVIEVAGAVFDTDPVLRRRVAFLRWHAPVPTLDAPESAAAVLLSHLHQDHCDLRSLRTLGRDRLPLVPGGSAGFFRRHGFTDVVAMHPGDVRQVGHATVTATTAAHDGRRYPIGRHRPAIGFLIEGGGSRVYFAGDTDVFDGMADLAPLDIALLPVAGWGHTIGPGHMDPVRAAEAVELLRPRVAVPIHWGTMRPVWHRRPGPGQTDAPALAFAAEVRRRGLPTTVTILRPGGSV